MSEVCFALNNLITGEQQTILQNQFTWPDIILKGLSYKFGAKYCTEALMCCQTMLDCADEDILQ